MFSMLLYYLTVFNLKLNLKLKIKPNTGTFKNLKEIQKTEKIFSKISGDL